MKFIFTEKELNDLVDKKVNEKLLQLNDKIKGEFENKITNEREKKKYWESKYNELYIIFKDFKEKIKLIK